MTVPGPPTVRELLVEAIIWWLEGRHHAAPGSALATCTPVAQLLIYNTVQDEAYHGCGQSHLEQVMEHLAHHGAAYMTADGQIVEANRPANTPDIPPALLERARNLYQSAAQAA